MFDKIVDFMATIFESLHGVIVSFGITDKGTSYVLAVCLFTLIVRLLILPLSIKSTKSNQKMQEIQPELNKLRKKYANNPEKLNMEMNKVMKENNVSMFGGCLPALLPLPILFALYYVFLRINDLSGASFLWISDLSQKDPYFILPILAAASTYIPSLLMSKSMPANEDSPMNMGTMNIVMSVMMGVMAINFNSLLVIYWIFGGVIQLVQTYFINYRPAMKKRAEANATTVKPDSYKIDSTAPRKKKANN